MENTNRSFGQLFNLSFGFFGVQIAYALQSANISRIFATLGADPHQLSFFWVLPPLMGMIVQPLIGKYSDKTWTRLGRRKPYLLVGALIALAVMILLPNAGDFTFAQGLFLGLSAAMWFGLFSLMFLDTSINIAMQPFKMMVGDMVNEEQKGTAYAIQSALCNAGSVVGYVFPYFFTWIGISNLAPEGVIPDSVKWSFYVGAAILIACVLYTFFAVKEMPPEEYAKFHGVDLKKEAEVVAGQLHVDRGTVRTIFLGLVTLGIYPLVVFSKMSKEINLIASKHDNRKTIPYWIMYIISTVFTFGIYQFIWWHNYSNRVGNELRRRNINYDFSERTFWIWNVLGSLILIGPIVFIHRLCRATNLLNSDYNKETLGIDTPAENDTVDLLIEAPSTFWTVGLVQFFCWSAFLFMWTYSPGAIASQCFGWDGITTAVAEYQNAADWVGIVFMVQAIGSLLWAMVIAPLEKRFGNKGAYAISLAVGAIGFVSTMFVTDQYVLFASYALIGAAWAAMLALPFTIFTNSLKGENIGYYLGLFNCTICLPQICAALIGGVILRLFCGGEQVGMLVVAGVLLLVGAVAVFLIREKEDE